MKVWLFGLSAGLSFVLLITAGSINSTEIQEQACPSLARDSDGDGMNDAYELFYGLNSTNSADALLDYDGDALTNLAESVKLTDPFCEDTDRDGFDDLIDSNAVSRAYIQWGNPQFTIGDQYEYAHPDWLLGAYKNGGEWVIMPDETATNTPAAYKSAWHASAYDSNGVASLNIDLSRYVLTNNLRYAIHYSAESNSSLFISLLDSNSMPVIEDLFGNLLAVSNVARYAVIPAEAGIQSNSVVLLLNISTATYPSAAVIQLRCGNVGAPLVGDRSENGQGEIPALSGVEVFIYEGLLYIDEDSDGLDADQERQLGTSDYSVDSNGNGTNDYDECFNSGSSTNTDGGGGGDGGDDGEDDHDGHKNKIIYVDQVRGNDTYTGRAPAISGKNKGPKKTVHAGLSIAETNDTIIIRSGTYNEDLNIQGKDVKVFIEGNVRL
jgi:hypothetical protein